MMKRQREFALSTAVIDLLVKELERRVTKELDIMVGGAIKNHDDYKYFLGKIHALKELTKFIKEG